LLGRIPYEPRIGGINDAATASIIAMTGLWKVEDHIRGTDAEARARRRQEMSAGIVADLFEEKGAVQSLREVQDSRRDPLRSDTP
jgi:hypothetical protein